MLVRFTIYDYTINEMLCHDCKSFVAFLVIVGGL